MEQARPRTLSSQACPKTLSSTFERQNVMNITVIKILRAHFVHTIFMYYFSILSYALGTCIRTHENIPDYNASANH